MSMEKITKEELKNLIGGKALSDDELEKVAGGDAYSNCTDLCKFLGQSTGKLGEMTICMSRCGEYYPQ